MTLTPKDDYVGEALGNLLEQFKNKENIKVIVSAFAEENQEAQDALFEVLNETTDIDAAIGAQLDGLGRIVGEPRSGRDDPTYRAAIRTRILLNVSTGTIEELITLVDNALGAGLFTIEIEELEPATIFVKILEPITDPDIDTSQASFFLNSGRAGGVKSFLWFYTTTTPFVFFEDTDPAGKGFDDGTTTVGGDWATVL